MVGSTHEEDPQRPELLRVCRIGRAQGLKGEVSVQSFTDEPERRFEPGAQLVTRHGERTFSVRHSRAFKGRWILHFDGAEDRDAAEALNGLELYAQADDAAEMAAEDSWYPKDLIGLEVRLAADNMAGLPAGQVVGTVVDVIDGAAQALLKIRLAAPTATDAANTALIPFVSELVPDIEPNERFLTIDPPGGLIPGLA